MMAMTAYARLGKRFASVVFALAAGAVISVSSADAETLADRIATAEAGATIKLPEGQYSGPITIDKSLTILGGHSATITGTGEGSVITIAAPDVTIKGLHIRGSGTSLKDMDAGVFINKKGAGARVEGNRIEGNLFGVYLWGSKNARVADNDIIGSQYHRMNERGNGVSVWNAPGSVIDGNRIRYGRDGIFVTTSKNNRFINNDFRNLRIAVHYMYANNSEVSGNRSYGNHVGYALMYSRNLTVKGNLSEDDHNHGILLNFTNQAVIRDNKVLNGRDKCVFIYNSNKSTFYRNHFEGCRIGVHFTAGSERNLIHGNAFIGNRTQIKYVGSRHLNWSHEGRGNYWSDHPSFDMNNDGIADALYRPNDLVDQVVWAHPRAKLLLNSPALQIVRFAQAQLPALHPGGVVDTAPLMVPLTVHLGKGK
jgi:nitrous oxidase accessory protein